MANNWIGFRDRLFIDTPQGVLIWFYYLVAEAEEFPERPAWIADACSFWQERLTGLPMEAFEPELDRWLDREDKVITLVEISRQTIARLEPLNRLPVSFFEEFFEGIGTGKFPSAIDPKRMVETGTAFVNLLLGIADDPGPIGHGRLRRRVYTTRSVDW